MNEKTISSVKEELDKKFLDKIFSVKDKTCSNCSLFKIVDVFYSESKYAFVVLMQDIFTGEANVRNIPFVDEYFKIANLLEIKKHDDSVLEFWKDEYAVVNGQNRKDSEESFASRIEIAMKQFIDKKGSV